MAHPMQRYGESSVLFCRYCERAFVRSSERGPAPKYCSQACRQRAYEKRHPSMTHEQWLAADPTSNIFDILETAGISKERLAGVLEPRVENWGSLVHAFEILTALSVLLEQWPDTEETG